MHMRSQISGWWTDNHYNCHLSCYLSLRRILPPQPQAWTTLSFRCNPLPLRYSMSLLTSLLTHDLPFTRVAQPLILCELCLAIPTWAQNLSRLQRLVVFNVMPQAISVTVEEPPIPFSPFSSADCTMLNHFSFHDFIAVAFPDIARDLDTQI